jgi:DNA-directed RNA polymerase subunit RPC12/RpoP
MRTRNEEEEMAKYTCAKCGMSVGTMTCGKCGKELEHATIQKPDGSAVHVSKCPDGHGKVKSPLCCGQDMACAV